MLIGIAILIGIAFYLFLLVYLLLLLMGTMLTFLEAYSIYFLADRYPLLADLLDRSTPTFPFYPPPPGCHAPPSSRTPFGQQVRRIASSIIAVP